MLLLSLVLAVAAPMDRFAFVWRGFPVGTVSIERGADGAYRYVSRHLHTRSGEATWTAQRKELHLDARGFIAGTRVQPQGAWLLERPRSLGCVTAREELGGREGAHCVRALEPRAVRGTMLGEAFRATYDLGGRLEALELGEARFVRLEGPARLDAPPDFFGQGYALERGSGPLRVVPAPAVPARIPGMTTWSAGPAEALAREVHASFTEKGPSAADFGAGGDVGGCLAHALRFAERARRRGHHVAIVHGLLAEAGRARPHAWVRIALAGGGTRDLDPTSLEPVRSQTHAALALVRPGTSAVQAGALWLSLARGERRVLRGR